MLTCYVILLGDFNIPLVTVAEGGGGVWCMTGGLMTVEGGEMIDG